MDANEKENFSHPISFREFLVPIWKCVRL